MARRVQGTKTMEAQQQTQTLGKERAEAIIQTYREGYGKRREEGEALVDALEAYLAAGGYKADRKAIMRLGIACGVIELARGRFGGPVSPLPPEERQVVKAARAIEAHKEPVDPFSGLSEVERNMIMALRAASKPKEQR